jgi:hypothetical protein
MGRMTLGAEAGRSRQPRASAECKDMDDADQKSQVLARAADRVCSLILNPEVPREAVDDEIASLRRLQQDLFPGQDELFTRIYLARVSRLLEQFRDEPGPSLA